MNIRDIFERIAFYVSVPKCVYCGDRLDYEDRGLCKKCTKIHEQHKERDCSRCSHKLSRCSCSNAFLSAHGVGRVIKTFRYAKTEQSMPSNYLIYSLKQDNRKDVISLLAEEVSDAIKNNLDLSYKDNFVITNVPRRKKAIIYYGFDHAAVLAKGISKKLGINYEQFLVSKSKKAQKTVQGRERTSNVRFDYKSKRNVCLRGKTIIIVDDIITTGSSICGCAMLLKAYRPKNIVAASVGIAYKDWYIPFE